MQREDTELAPLSQLHLFCASEAKEPSPQDGGISCWGSTVVQVRPRAGSCVCSVGLGSRWLCTHWSAAVGRSWLCHQESGYSCSGSMGEEGRNQRGRGEGRDGQRGQAKAWRSESSQRRNILGLTQCPAHTTTIPSQVPSAVMPYALFRARTTAPFTQPFASPRGLPP